MLQCSFSLAAALLLVKMTSALQKSQCCSATSAAQRSQNCSATSVFACGMLQGWGLEGWGLGLLDLLNQDFGSILSVFPRKNSKTQSLLNLLQSGPRKFTKSDFSGLAPIRRVLIQILQHDLRQPTVACFSYRGVHSPYGAIGSPYGCLWGIRSPYGLF